MIRDAVRNAMEKYHARTKGIVAIASDSASTCSHAFDLLAPPRGVFLACCAHLLNNAGRQLAREVALEFVRRLTKLLHTSWAARSVWADVTRAVLGKERQPPRQPRTSHAGAASTRPRASSTAWCVLSVPGALAFTYICSDASSPPLRAGSADGAHQIGGKAETVRG